MSSNITNTTSITTSTEGKLYQIFKFDYSQDVLAFSLEMFMNKKRERITISFFFYQKLNIKKKSL